MTLPSHPTTPQFAWNETAGRYVNSFGQFVKFSDVRDALESVMDASAIRMNNLTQQLVDSRVSLAEWQSGMMEQIKLAHTAAAAASRGGWAQMSQADWGAAGRMVRDQYDFLRGFANQIANGTQALDGRALVRADLYGDAPRGTFEEMRRRYETLMNGMEEARRVLGPADHCEDCLEYAAQGWIPIEQVPRIGNSICLTRCHCSMEYRRSGDAEAVIEE
jgi:hypothetical protein